MFSNLAILISSFQIKLASFCVSDGSGNPFIGRRLRRRPINKKIGADVATRAAAEAPARDTPKNKSPKLMSDFDIITRF